MIDSMDIHRSIVELLKENFKKIKVQTKDIKNPRPPCFYVKDIADSGRQTATEYETTSYSYAVIYFSKQENLEDLLTVKEYLKRILRKPLKVVAYEDPEDINYIEINDVVVTLDENDYFFNCVFSIEHIQKLGVQRFESSNNELMEEMELNISSCK